MSYRGAVLTDEELIDHLLTAEGWPKYSEHSADRGGATKGGITLPALLEWRGRRCTREELQALSEHEARQIYRHRYIIEPGFDKITDSLLRYQLVDCGVLHGPMRAVRWLQETLGVTRDGVLGPITAEAVEHADAHRVGLLMAALRQEFLGRLVTRSPSQAVFAHGWARRAAGFVRLEAGRA